MALASSSAATMPAACSSRRRRTSSRAKAGSRSTWRRRSSPAAKSGERNSAVTMVPSVPGVAVMRPRRHVLRGPPGRNRLEHDDRALRRLEVAGGHALDVLGADLLPRRLEPEHGAVVAEHGLEEAELAGSAVHGLQVPHQLRAQLVLRLAELGLG